MSELSYTEKLLDGVEIEWKELGEVCRFINGKAYKKPELLEKGKYPVLRVGNFFTNDKWYYSNLELNEDKYCDDGDLLYAWSASFGPRIWEGGKVIYHYHIWKVIPETEIISKKYLFYLLDWDTEALKAEHGTGSTMMHVGKGAIEKRVVPVPPLKVQTEIVRILDRFTTLASELKAELKAELTARKHQYAYYSEKLLTLNETDIEWKELGGIGDFTYGYVAKAQEAGNARFVRITDINSSGKLIADKAKYVDISEANEKFFLKKNDLLMARTGATYGKTMLFEEDYPAIYAGFLIKLSFDENVIIPKYYWHFAQSKLFWDQAEKLVSGGGQPQFNANVLKLVKIPVLPLIEQQRIVEILDEFDALNMSLTEGLAREIALRQQQYKYYREQLLSFPKPEVADHD